MSFLSRISLANKGIVALATIAILLFGAYIIPSLKEELYPSLSFPAITVTALYQGASPSIIEQNVTNPLEKSIQGVQGIQSITSYSNEGSAVILVQYNFGTDINQASQTLTQQINKSQASLPSGVTAQVQTFNISDQPVIQLAVTSSQDTATLAANLQNNVIPTLQGISGVANVNVTGVRNQIVSVILDLTKLKNQGLSVNQVLAALQSNNVSIPAGELSANGQSLAIKVGNTFNSLDDLKNVVVGEHIIAQASNCPQLSGVSSSFPGAGAGTGFQSSAKCVPPKTTSTPVALSSVATVQQALAASTTLTRTNGKDSLGVSITKSSDGNTVSISQSVNQQLTALQNKLGNGAQITVVSDQAPSISSSINSLVDEGLIGAGFAILVILVFLLSLRSTLVTAISIPLSIVIALIGLYVGNFTLNLLSLGGLTIAIGRVIDDSIVVLENIHRHLNNGEEKRDAIPRAVKEVSGAVTASTLTTVAVFLPIAFVGGIVGELFTPFSVTVTIALVASLFVALTIIPVLAYWFLQEPKAPKTPKTPTASKNVSSKQNGHERGNFLERGYVPMLRWVTSHKAITIIVSVLLFVFSLSLLSSIGTTFFGSQQADSFSISQTLPLGSSLSTTNAAAKQVESVLAGVPHIKFYQVTIGSSGSGAGAFLGGGSASYNSANFSVTTDTADNEATVQQQVANDLKTLTNVGTVRVATSSSGGGFNSSSVSVNVQAPNDTSLRQAAQQVLAAVSQVANTTNVSSNLSDAAPLVNVIVDSQRAASYGLTASQVGQELREIYTGVTVSTITLNGIQENVSLSLGTPATSVADMQNLLLPTQTGNVKLSAVANVTQGYGPTQITHIGGARTATISATVTSQNTGAVSSAIQKQLSKLVLPAGATYSLGGVTASQAQAFSGLELALLAAIALVYIIMVGTFRSLVQPLILLVSIPFAATGSLILLVVTHTPLGVPALIGLLMLVGIVVTNAIVLLDLVNQYRMKGLDALSAVIEGGRRRLRPILMTAIATILALSPMALGLSQSSGFIAAPLAITVIGGLTSSTILTLLLVPTLYVLVEGKRGRSSNKPKPIELEDTLEHPAIQAPQLSAPLA
ncbi:MAG: efflux RND transporter permease subunit [Ktedonobacteraceae bacterium]